MKALDDNHLKKSKKIHSLTLYNTCYSSLVQSQATSLPCQVRITTGHFNSSDYSNWNFTFSPKFFTQCFNSRGKVVRLNIQDCLSLWIVALAHGSGWNGVDMLIYNAEVPSYQQWEFEITEDAFKMSPTCNECRTES